MLAADVVGRLANRSYLAYKECIVRWVCGDCGAKEGNRKLRYQHTSTYIEKLAAIYAVYTLAKIRNIKSRVNCMFCGNEAKAKEGFRLRPGAKLKRVTRRE